MQLTSLPTVWLTGRFLKTSLLGPIVWLPSISGMPTS